MQHMARSWTSSPVEGRGDGEYPVSCDPASGVAADFECRSVDELRYVTIWILNANLLSARSAGEIEVELRSIATLAHCGSPGWLN